MFILYRIDEEGGKRTFYISYVKVRETYTKNGVQYFYNFYVIKMQFVFLNVVDWSVTFIQPFQ